MIVLLRRENRDMGRREHVKAERRTGGMSWVDGGGD